MTANDESGRAVAAGHLYVVATPIGNLGDLSPRALAVLGAVDRIAAEDTRTTGALLAHFGVRTPLVALHEHNEDRMAARLVEALAGGGTLALVSDAGTPLISDPGFATVRAARAAGVPVVAVPGPCAAVAALSISGIATDSFVFAGFLPPKTRARRERLSQLGREPRSVVIYESSHRIAESLADAEAVLGASRRACVARELTKRFEESHTASLAELREWLAADANRSRGQFVLVLEGAAAQAADAAAADDLLNLLLTELPPSRAARLAAAISGVPRAQLYARALQLGAQETPHDNEENGDNSVS
jgi:16S rRNA (cytidine1402-2'-O)-methyltransferase